MSTQQSPTISQQLFKGMKNDLGQKFASREYFYDVKNFLMEDIIGATKALCPIQAHDRFAKTTSFNTLDDVIPDTDDLSDWDTLRGNSSVLQNFEFSPGNDIDGIFDYKFLDQNNILQSKQ